MLAANTVETFPTKILCTDKFLLMKAAWLSRDLSSLQLGLLGEIVDSQSIGFGNSKRGQKWYAQAFKTSITSICNALSVLKDKGWITIIKSHGWGQKDKITPNWDKSYKPKQPNSPKKGSRNNEPIIHETMNSSVHETMNITNQLTNQLTKSPLTKLTQLVADSDNCEQALNSFLVREKGDDDIESNHIELTRNAAYGGSRDTIENGVESNSDISRINSTDGPIPIPEGLDPNQAFAPIGKPICFRYQLYENPSLITMNLTKEYPDLKLLYDNYQSTLPPEESETAIPKKPQIQKKQTSSYKDKQGWNSFHKEVYAGKHDDVKFRYSVDDVQFYKAAIKFAEERVKDGSEWINIANCRRRFIGWIKGWVPRIGFYQEEFS